MSGVHDGLDFAVMLVQRRLDHGAFDVRERRSELVVKRHGDFRSVDRPRGRPLFAEDHVRQVRRRQHFVAFGESDHPPQLVVQLPHVAGPRIEQQVLHRFFGEADVALLEFLSVGASATK